MRITEVQEDMGLSLETSQQFVFVGEFEMHDLYGVDMIVFLVARNIDGGKIAPSSFINEFITTFDDTSNHVTVHGHGLLVSRATVSGYIIHHSRSCVMRS